MNLWVFVAWGRVHELISFARIPQQIAGEMRAVEPYGMISTLVTVRLIPVNCAPPERLRDQIGGGRGIRTLEGLAALALFKSAPINHSGIPPGPSAGVSHSPGLRGRGTEASVLYSDDPCGEVAEWPKAPAC